MKNKKREHNKFVDETILRELYLTLSISKICEILDISRSRINKLLDEYNIKKRSMSDTIKLDSVKNLFKETNLKKYGTEHYTQTSEYKENLNKISLERYGTNYPSQSDKVKRKTKKTNLNKYGVEFYTQTNEYKERVLKTNLEKYGVDNPSKNEEVKKQIKETKFQRYGNENYTNPQKNKLTNLERYGVEFISQIDWVKDKVKKTNLENYGVEYYSQTNEYKERVLKTNLEKYGVSSPLLLETSIERAKQKMLHLYGCEHGFQNLEIQNKIAKSNKFKIKEYKFPSGRIDNVLGYEPYMLDILINEGIEENDIFTNFDCPIIKWFDYQEKEHKHIPDIFIKSKNTIIEVKSEYTSGKEFIQTILLKKQYAESQGFIYKIIVIDKKTKKVKYEIS
jgi:hypothetical protein